MAYDALLALQSSVTKTATFNGTGVSIPFGTTRRGLNARVIYSAATNASGSNSVQFQVDISPDGGSTWTRSILSDPVVLSTTAQAGVIQIPFMTPDNRQAWQVRLTATFSGAGSTPTITYSADMGNAFP
jgi:hypothetical protein